jgi:hypothetical protein
MASLKRVIAVLLFDPFFIDTQSHPDLCFFSEKNCSIESRPVQGGGGEANDDAIRKDG